MSSKTDDDGLEEYNKFRGRYYDNNSSSDSDDDFFNNDSDDEDYFYSMRGDFSMQRNMHAANMHSGSSGMHMHSSEPKRGNVSAPVYRRAE